MNARPSTRALSPITLAALTGLAMLTGCAQMQVKRLATPDGSEVYELRGRDPGRLAAEASLRCPHGYDALRQSHKRQTLESALTPARWWNAAEAYLEDAGSQSQLLVSCKVPPPPAPLPLPVTTDGSAK